MSQNLIITDNHESLFQFHPDMIFLFNKNLRLINANKKAIKYMKKLGGSVLPITYIHPQDKNKAQANFEKTITGLSTEDEYIIVSSDGSHKFFHIVSIPYYSADKINGAYVIARDVTNEKQREKIILDENEKFCLLAENIKEVFWIGSPDYTRCLYVSPAYEELWGLSCESAYENPLAFLEVVHPEDLQDIEMLIKSRNDESYMIDFRIILPNGDVRWVRDTGFPVKNSKGEGFFVGVSTDITELKNREELLQKTEKLSIIGKLAAGVAHEIRNPLTVINGLLRLDPSGNTRRSYEPIIYDELDRIETILNQFLLLAKPFQDETFSLIDINAVLIDCLSSLETEINVTNVQVDFSSDCAGDLIYGNEEQLHLVFKNIIKNALEAIDGKGNIDISLESTEDEAIITVKDNGRGLSKERLLALGEPYFSNTEKGIGIGLMVSYKVIECHQGSISFSSIENGGTSVKISLPLNRRSS
ncbi:PAS domain-containing sensor histidine kinase [Pseudalkalibacillus caeni]|uniref:histidine kinase n=1 Tax=Exobacillus caeni TaxID=2574798 RepID=A0A5R9F4E8_9BACL|nr:PAS domain-containing sensor histidine kinase [Pseudalkalibacillus caeni]TLS37901.1 PAS domain S-box protein [Pseudalkalibacillus caeni]